MLLFHMASIASVLGPLVAVVMQKQQALVGKLFRELLTHQVKF